MNSPSQDSPRDWDEFRLLIESSRDYFGLFLKGAAFYFALLAAALKIFFDLPEGSNGRQAVFAFGALVNLWAVFVCFFAARAHRHLIFRAHALSERLGVPNVYTTTSVATSFAVLVGIIVFTLFWFLLRWL